MQQTIRFDEALQVRQPVDVMASVRKRVQVANQWWNAKSETFSRLCGTGGKIFPKSLGGFRISSYLCQRKQDSGKPLGRAHVRRSAFSMGFFNAHSATVWRLPFRKKELPSGWSHYLVSSGMCSRFSVSPCRRNRRWKQDSAIMQQTIRFDEALQVRQPVDVMASVRKWVQVANQWWNAKSETFSRLCGTGGKIFPKSLGGFRISSYLCQRLTDDGKPSGWAHVRRSATNARVFLLPMVQPYSGCFLVRFNCPLGESSSVNQREVQPLSVSPCRRNRRWLTDDAIMQQTIRFDEALQVRQPVDVMASVRKRVQVANQWWNAKSETFSRLCGFRGKIFPKSLGGFRISSYLCQRLQMAKVFAPLDIGQLSGNIAGLLLCPHYNLIGGCHSVNEISPTGEVVICNQRDVQPFLCISVPAEPAMVTNDAIMQQTIRFDEALQVRQPVDVMASVRKWVQVANQWWNAKSETFSRLCATEEGETFTHGQVVLANMGVLLLVLIMGVAGWLEGGAA